MDQTSESETIADAVETSAETATRSSVGRARVAVIGAGAGGLMAAWTLKQAGIEAKVYEGSDRIGGRIQSVTGRLGSGLVTELGAEFIDSGHTEMLAVAKRFGLVLLDNDADPVSDLTISYYFSGTHYSEAQIMDEFESIALRIKADLLSLSTDISESAHSAIDVLFDRMSIAEYLDRVGVIGWMRKLLEVAYTTEYGAAVDCQSCLNLLSVLSLDTAEGFSVFGESDERFRILGGNERIVQALAQKLDGQIELGRRLVSLRERGAGYQLEFEGDGRSTTEAADCVVLAIPFSVLRDVTLRVDLPQQKRHAIETLGYGSGEKLAVGLTNPVWRRAGRDGVAFSDLAFQSGWDSSRLQGTGASYTFFLGGTEAAQLQSSRIDEHAAAYVEQADAMFPGMRDAYTGVSVATGWCSNPLSRGSYSCYRPGQWTTIRGWEGKPIGNLYFVGEHCSLEHQGFMNGAMETGRKAAETIIEKLGFR